VGRDDSVVDVNETGNFELDCVGSRRSPPVQLIRSDLIDRGLVFAGRLKLLDPVGSSSVPVSARRDLNPD
jgi:hypothetical protein